MGRSRSSRLSAAGDTRKRRLIAGTGAEFKMSWTEERIERLKKMWHDGATASQIADELGGVSRNAVIGKAHRLGLEQRPSPVKAGEEKDKKKAQTPAPAATKPVAKAEAASVRAATSTAPAPSENVRTPQRPPSELQYRS